MRFLPHESGHQPGTVRTVSDCTRPTALNRDARHALASNPGRTAQTWRRMADKCQDAWRSMVMRRAASLIEWGRQ